MWQLSSGVFLGWSLGANDAANVFGPAVASRMVRFGTSAALCSIFVVAGALLQGSQGMHTYQELSPIGSLNVAFIVSLAAAATVTLMTLWGLPVSTSQSVVGSLLLVGLMTGNLQTEPLIKVLICWVSTPVGAMIASASLYLLLGKAMNKLDMDIFSYDRNLKTALVLAGSYGAYALGANNVANVTGAFVGENMLTPFWACLIGSLAISLGVITYSRNVMMTVGRGLVKLDAFSAFIVVLSKALTVHIFAWIGVPVSTSQAIVGAVLGIGLVKGVKTVDRRVLWRILFGWIGTPAVSFILAAILYYVFLH